MQKGIGTFELVIGGSILIFIISGLFIILYYHFSRKIILSRLQQNNQNLEHQKDLLKNEIAIIENERKRIARDLHDEIGANLAYIGINIAQIAKEIPLEEISLHEQIASCHDQLNKVITDVRRISHEMLPPILEMFGLIPSIEEFINNIKSTFEIDFYYDESFNTLNQDTALQLYRVLLELINNSIKHSGGTRISIQFLDMKEKRKIHYSDNGIGFDLSTLKNKDGLGLKNIISRLELIDATFSCSSNIEKGFYIEIDLNERSWKDIH